MSQSNSGTTWTISIQGPINSCTGGFNPQQDNWTDADALAIATALNTVAWPEGTSWSVIKVTGEETIYNADPNQNPIVFD